MPDEPAATASPSAGGNDPAAGQAPAAGQGNGSGTSQDGGTTTTTGTDGQPFDPERAQALIDKQRQELKELKVQAKAGSDAAARLKQLEDAQKDDLQKAQDKIAELEAANATATTRAQELVTRNAIEMAARAAGAIRPELTYRLVDTAEIEYADDGQPKNIDAAIGSLKQRAPELFGQAPTSVDQGARTTAAGSEGDMNSILRKAAGR